MTAVVLAGGRRLVDLLLGLLEPVLHHAQRGREPQPREVVEQEVFVPGEQVGDAGLVGVGQQVGLVDRDLARGQGRGCRRHGAQLAGPLQLPPGGHGRQVALPGQPGCGGLGAVAGPHPAGVPGGQVPGPQRGQPGLLPLQADDQLVQLVVAQPVRFRRRELVDRSPQRFHTSIMTNIRSLVTSIREEILAAREETSRFSIVGARPATTPTNPERWLRRLATRSRC